MSEFYEDEGLTIDNQESPDLNEGVTEPTADGSDEGVEIPAETQEEAPAPKPTTKRVSDRINAIRAENDAKLNELQSRLDDANRQLLTYRANEEGITVEELVMRDKMEEENFRNALHNDPEFIALQQRDFERQKAEVLTQLQDSFPKDGIQDLDALPAVFFRQLQAGVDPVTAYRASVAEAQKATPPSTGSVKSQGETTKGNLTEADMESMSTEDWIRWLDENET
jgi:hypothetical protein